ncbi:ASCH domain-containing protein [Methylobacterium haplocladii]|nr:ASCH domain-containing protein [Methylobacterium haplocladii]GJD85433.1 hypothetical protein HPGCJGGD_3322 [Methylobacterium haplocladii]
MVAYNFPDWMVPGILSGAKTHTVRKPKTPPYRHAAPGDRIRLYAGMRTKASRIILEPVCSTLQAADFVFPARAGATTFTLDGQHVDPEAFAIADGFRDLAHMRGFWFATHAPRGAETLVFSGALIAWTSEA